jgi:hypothetical protein
VGEDVKGRERKIVTGVKKLLSGQAVAAATVGSLAAVKISLILLLPLLFFLELLLVQHVPSCNKAERLTCIARTSRFC